ncbi:Dephospho-CoA kinase [Arachis hypogaea]|nr:Dephospho-CoA kinase [Arachis hypogaea]
MFSISHLAFLVLQIFNPCSLSPIAVASSSSASVVFVCSAALPSPFVCRSRSRSSPFAFARRSPLAFTRCSPFEFAFVWKPRCSASNSATNPHAPLSHRTALFCPRLFSLFQISLLPVFLHVAELRSSDGQSHHRRLSWSHSSQRIGEAALTSSETDADLKHRTRSRGYGLAEAKQRLEAARRRGEIRVRYAGWTFGLTGGIASGKSTVSNLFKSHGVPVVDADVVARDALKKGSGGWKKVVAAFGEEILLENGEVNRPMLGQIVFSDPDKRQFLNRLLAPHISSGIFWEVVKLWLKGYKIGPTFFTIKLHVLYCLAQHRSKASVLILSLKLTNLEWNLLEMPDILVSN